MNLKWLNPKKPIINCKICGAMENARSRTQKYCKPCAEQKKRATAAEYAKRKP